jgi:hypothetical protein
MWTRHAQQILGLRGCGDGTVNLIGSGCDKARGEAGRTTAYARAATPVTAAQV